MFDVIIYIARSLLLCRRNADHQWRGPVYGYQDNLAAL